MGESSKFPTLFKSKYKYDCKIPDKVKQVYKNGTSDWIGPQPGDTKPILYISSIVGAKKWNDKKFRSLTGIRHRCFSYAYCGGTSPLAHKKHIHYLDLLLKFGTRIFMDSGAHSLHRMLRSGKTLAKGIAKEDRLEFVEHLTDEYIDAYAEYIRWTYASGKRFDFHVTLDAQRNCSLIYKITKKLYTLGIYPIPVYHGDDSLDWVRRYIDDGHKLLGVGISRKGIKGREAEHRYYSSLFELTEKYGIQCHGFAVTGAKMFTYPWYSVDSATYIKAATFGKILTFTPEKYRLAQVHISDNYSDMTSYGNISALSSGALKHVKRMVEDNGFDFEVLKKDSLYRIMYNALVMNCAVKENTKHKVEFATWGSLV